MVGVETAFEIADVDAARILQAFQVQYTTQGEDGPVVPTPEETVHRIAQDVIDGLAAQTVQYDKTQAAAQAASNVPPIDITVVPTVVP
jgi:hypothetical protein